MLQRIGKAISSLWKTEGQALIETPQTLRSSFQLCYGTLNIGTLQLADGIWTFSYSQEFKDQDTIKPITEFPNPNKTYQSEALFPFFVHRIPSLSQPKVQDTIRHEKIEPNEVALLKRFGEFSISNPFRLFVAPVG
jgi:HipA-like protein